MDTPSENRSFADSALVSSKKFINDFNNDRVTTHGILFANSSCNQFFFHMKRLQLTQTRNTGQAKKVIAKLLKKFPRWIQTMTRHSIEVIPQQREKLGEKIDGSYEHETERILFWDPDSNDELGLFIILSHEIGHKIYQEILETRTQQQWLKIFSQEYVEKSVQESYPSHTSKNKPTRIGLCEKSYQE